MLTLLVASAIAQSPEDDWRMVKTEHFRFHYPIASESWSLHTAARLEAVRALVAAEVGYAPRRRVDVVITDPIADANGYAWPVVRRPSMALYPTSPAPTSFLGDFRSWPEELVVHEDTHLVHLLRPSRNRTLHTLTSLLWTRRGPILVAVPHWVIEGYATLVEGRLTGFGRPPSHARAAFLRSLAAEGALPTYARLDSRRAWGSGANPYLVGSAFLEWLENRTHPGALRDVWARLTAVELRTFDEAFAGVFGDEPEALYQRFVAEVTYEALRIERARPEDSNLWEDLDGSVSPPAISPDGSRLAVIRRGRRGPARLVVYATAPDPEARTRWEEYNLPDLEVDPDDVAPVPPSVYSHEPSSEQVLAGYAPTSCRWIDDETLLFTSLVRDGSGDLHPELFLWSGEGRIRALTHGARVRDADPQGGRAFGLQTGGGLSKLVRVDLRTGAVVPLTHDGPDVALATPRVRPDGAALALLANRGAGWQIEVAPLTPGGDLAGPLAVVDLPPGADPLSIAWRPDGSGLVASLGLGGFIELYDSTLDGGPWEQLTRSRGGAMFPAPAPDGEAVFYLVRDADGFDLHQLVLDRVETGPRPPSDAEILPVLGAEAPVVPPAIAPAPPLPIHEVVPARYGVGRAHVELSLAGTRGPQQESTELGTFVGDVVGRYELAPIVSLRGVSYGTTVPDLLARALDGPGDDPEARPPAQGFGYRGARLTLTWRGLPVRLRLDGAHLDLGSTYPEWIGALDLYRRQLGSRAGIETRVSGLWVRPGEGPPTLAVDGRLDGYGRHWLGPYFVGVGADAGGRLGLDGSGAETPVRAGGWLGWGTGRFAMGAEAEVIRNGVTLGGIAEPLFPVAYTTHRSWAPGLPPDVRTGLDGVDRIRAGVSVAPVELFAERHSVVDGPRTGSLLAADGGYTRFGLEASGSIVPRPLLTRPGLYVEGGVACVAETPGEGWRAKPCQRISEYGAWLSIRFQPGRETAIPHSAREASSR